MHDNKHRIATSLGKREDIKKHLEYSLKMILARVLSLNTLFLALICTAVLGKFAVLQIRAIHLTVLDSNCLDSKKPLFCCLDLD